MSNISSFRIQLLSLPANATSTKTYLKFVSLAIIITANSLACAQSPTRHFQQDAYHPPGWVSQHQATRSPRFMGHVQAVEIHVPKGAHVGFSSGQQWESKIKVGLMLGHAYRLKVSHIPENPAGEVYPSIEIINRLHPPAGQEEKFPIPIHITQRDLEHALAGRLVVRVVYLENPNASDPIANKEDDPDQRTTNALPEEDPLQLADEYGRPMAIVRLGSRVPDPRGQDDFFNESAPVTLLPMETSTPTTDAAFVKPPTLAPIATQRWAPLNSNPIVSRVLDYRK